MAHIAYLPDDAVPECDRVSDRDHVIRVHSVNSPVMQGHYHLYRSLMHGDGPLSRQRREMIAVAVSAANGCHY